MDCLRWVNGIKLLCSCDNQAASCWGRSLRFLAFLWTSTSSRSSLHKIAEKTEIWLPWLQALWMREDLHDHVTTRILGVEPQVAQTHYESSSLPGVRKGMRRELLLSSLYLTSPQTSFGVRLSAGRLLSIVIWAKNCRSKKGIKQCLRGLKCSQNTKKNKKTLKASFKAMFNVHFANLVSKENLSIQRLIIFLLYE